VTGHLRSLEIHSVSSGFASLQNFPGLPRQCLFRNCYIFYVRVPATAVQSGRPQCEFNCFPVCSVSDLLSSYSVGQKVKELQTVLILQPDTLQTLLVSRPTTFAQR